MIGRLQMFCKNISVKFCIGIFIFFVITTMIFMLGCEGKRGSLSPNIQPIVEITSFDGIEWAGDLNVEDSTIIDSLSVIMDSTLYYQKIYWRGWDEDGCIKGYAYRIGSWNEDSTAFIYDKAYGIVTNNEGWVLHYKPGADPNIPLSESNGTIWASSNKVSAVVYFPATDTTDFKKNFNKFEVKCKDNRGNVSEPDIKYFCSFSTVPSPIVTTSQGKIDSCRVGNSIKFKFDMTDPDPYGVSKEAAYYLYRLVYIERVGTREDTLTGQFQFGTTILDSTEWYSTENYDQTDEVLLKGNYDNGNTTRPILRGNDINELTRIEVKAVDKAGVASTKIAHLTFFVRDYFTPKTTELEDMTDQIYAIGKYHYFTYFPSTISIIPPSKFIGGNLVYGGPLYPMFRTETDTVTIWSAIWSTDLQIQLPIFKGETKDALNNDYYSEIIGFDINWDNGVDNLPPFPHQLIEDEDGTKWFRLEKRYVENNRLKLFDFSPGHHTFKVRAVDSGGKVDKTPSELELFLREPASEKNGILLVDDSNNTTFEPDDAVDSFFDSLLIYAGVNDYDVKDLEDGSQTSITGYFDKIVLSPADIFNYELIIWHNSNVTRRYKESQFYKHYLVLYPYMMSGGNVVYTGPNVISDSKADISYDIGFLKKFAGFSSLNDILTKSLFIDDRYFDVARKDNAGSIFPDSLHINVDLNTYTSIAGKIGAVTFLDIDGATSLFSFSTTDPYPMNGCVVSKYTNPNTNSTAYIIGFPLYYIEPEQAKELMKAIIQDLPIEPSL